jgi:D-psicose/D-tagatose/L-ribulose 3-epimerase
VLLGCIVKTADQAEYASGLPLDYLELKGEMLCVEPAELDALSARLRSAGLPIRAMTSPLPRRYGCRVVGDDADTGRALAVFREMIDKAAALGVEVVVLGSGQARSYPDTYDPDLARRQFLEFALTASALCAERGIRLTIEPLNRTETNLLNSCAETRELIEGTPLTIAVDCFHVVSEGLSIADELAAAAARVGHAHTSSLPRGTGDYQPDVQREFVRALGVAGYAGRLTIEEDFADFDRDSPVAVKVFCELLGRGAPVEPAGG